MEKSGVGFLGSSQGDAETFLDLNSVTASRATQQEKHCLARKDTRKQHLIQACLSRKQNIELSSGLPDSSGIQQIETERFH